MYKDEKEIKVASSYFVLIFILLLSSSVILTLAVIPI